MNQAEPSIGIASTAAVALELIRRARTASDVAALHFIVVNDTHLLAPYRQAALWFEVGATTALSGVVDIERNAPYVQWVNATCKRLANKGAGRIDRNDLDERHAAEWSDWLPEHGLWIPIAASDARDGIPRGGVLFARDTPWTDDEIHDIYDWIDTWRFAYHARAEATYRRSWSARWHRFKKSVRTWRIALVAAAAAALSVPVPLTVLAPGELVPAEPVAVRAPLDGVVSEFYVRPNQAVKKGDRLFAFDDIAIGSKYDVAVQALRTAEAELRQYEQQALMDPKARAQLPSARGTVAERRAELDFLKTQRSRSTVVAPNDGYVIFDDPSEWIGRPVSTGERILRLASPQDKEIEAWMGAADAIPLPEKASARLYLSASPLDPVAGSIRYISHDAVRRPDGVYAYRVRAVLDRDTPHRIGLKGTVRLAGEEVPLAYWIVRRPLATIREFFGI
ncbi:MAG: efflux RND transporter periplasmic adaptor subunit [Rhodospirillaceae bacterium]